MSMAVSNVLMGVFGILVIIASLAMPRAARRVFIHAVWIYAFLALISVVCVVAIIRCLLEVSSHCSALAVTGLAVGGVVSAYLPGFALWRLVAHVREERELMSRWSRQAPSVTAATDAPQ